MAKTVISPKENVAQEALLIVQDAQTQIKEIIVEAKREGIPKEEVEKLIAKIIREAANKLPDNLKESAKLSLAQNAQKWHYMHNQAMDALDASLRNTVERVMPVEAIEKAYNIRLGDDIDKGPLIDRFRPMLSEDRAGIAIINRYEQRVKEQIRLLASNPANLTRLDRNGKVYKVNLRNFAEMSIRYEANLEDVEQLADSGVHLVWTSSHVDASPRCEPYQGRLYSLDGSSGTKDGIPYTPLDDALAGPRGDGNGIISGYNCRHRLIEYAPGSKAPKEYDKATIKKENAITGRQRLYERDIRNLKIEERLLRKGGYIKEASTIRKKWQSKTASYERYSLNNERAYYPWRTRIISGVEDIG